MATRRKKSGYPTLAQWLDHPIKSWKRTARKIDVDRAAWLKEKNKIKADRAKAKLTRDTELAKRRVAADRKKATKAKQAADRKKAAEARAQQNAARPTVVHARVAPTAPARPAPRPPARPAMRSAPAPQRPTSAATPPAVLCGSTQTDDGKPCCNPTTGGPCSAGHKPKNKPTSGPTPRTNTASGDQRIAVQFGGGRAASRNRRASGGATFNNVGNNVRVGEQVDTINGPVNVRVGDRTRDWAGRPLSPDAAEFYRLRDVEGYKGPIQWDKGQMPFKVDENGNRIG